MIDERDECFVLERLLTSGESTLTKLRKLMKEISKQKDKYADFKTFLNARKTQTNINIAVL